MSIEESPVKRVGSAPGTLWLPIYLGQPAHWAVGVVNLHVLQEFGAEETQDKGGCASCIEPTAGVFAATDASGHDRVCANLEIGGRVKNLGVYSSPE